ncbi:MAG TPA: hypothetical protein VJH23_05505 [archaeon]|nr:hypothetical protein [archaeon]
MKNYLYFSICLVLLFSFVLGTPIAQIGGNEFFANEIKMTINQLGIPNDSNAVVYSDSNLSSYIIAKNSKVLSSEQVCISIGKNKTENTFKIIEKGRIIQPLGNYRVSTTVICDRMNEFEGDLSSYNNPNFQFVDLKNDCAFDLTKTERACLVVLGDTTPGPALNPSVAGNTNFAGFLFSLLLILLIAATYLVLPILVKGFSKKKFYIAKLALWILAYILTFIFTIFAPIALMAVVLLQPILSFFALKHITPEVDGTKTALLAKILMFLEFALILIWIVIFIILQTVVIS